MQWKNEVHLNHCRVIQDLLAKTTYDSVVEVANPIETYPTDGSALWACGVQAIQECVEDPTSGVVWAYTYIYSCYAPPSLTMAEFEEILIDLGRKKAEIKNHRRCICIGNRTRMFTEECKKALSLGSYWSGSHLPERGVRFGCRSNLC